MMHICPFPAHQVALQGLPLPRNIRKGSLLLQVPPAALQDLGQDTPVRGSAHVRNVLALTAGMTLPQVVSTLYQNQLKVADLGVMREMRRQNTDP